MKLAWKFYDALALVQLNKTAGGDTYLVYILIYISPRHENKY